MDRLMKRFGEKLRTLRQRRGLTVRELARLLEVNSHSHIVGLESDKHKPSAALLLKVAVLFDVSTDQLMRDDYEIDK
jgi:transcriptional regulator with XRE-family HTH domain